MPKWDDKVEEWERLLKDYTAVDIGRFYGLSKGAILGAIYRRRKKDKETIANDLCTVDRHNIIELTTPKRNKGPYPVEVNSFLDVINGDTCRWLGSSLKESSYEFCGHERAIDSPYCIDHLKRSKRQAVVSDES